MPLPIIAAVGAAIVVAGVVGAAASGAMGKATTPTLREPDADKFGDPGSDAYRAELAARRAAVDGRAAPQAGGPYLMAAAQAKLAQMDPETRAAIMAQRKALSAQLMDQMQGKGPSLATMQMQQGLDQSLAAQTAAAASMRGKANTALAMRNIAQQAGGAQQQAAGASAMMRYQEQMGAQQQMAALTNAMHGQEMAELGEANKIGLANAGFAQQAGLANKQSYDEINLANAKMQLEAMGMNDAQIRAFLGLDAAQRSADREAGIEYEKARMGQGNKWAEMDAANEADAKRRKAAFWGSLTGAGASMLGGAAGGGK